MSAIKYGEDPKPTLEQLRATAVNRTYERVMRTGEMPGRDDPGIKRGMAACMESMKRRGKRTGDIKRDEAVAYSYAMLAAQEASTVVPLKRGK